MLMPMMSIRYMRVFVCDLFMPMPMAVTTLWHRIMAMTMVTVFMRMRVFVIHSFMHMLVLVRFRKVNHHTNEHQHAAKHKAPTS